jgi:hypothetical protein
MAQPTGSDLHVNTPLTNISVAYMQGNESFIADKVFPSVPVDFKSNIYYKYNRGDWFRTAAQKRAPRTESVGTGWSVTSDSYLCDVQAVHVDIADQDRANQDRPVLDMDRDGTLLVTRDMLLRRELDWVSNYFGKSKWTGDADQKGASTASTDQFIQWDRSSATPIEDFATWSTNMQEKTGMRPNVLVIGQRVFDGLKNCDEFIERIKYTQRGVLTLDLIASLLDIPKVLVPAVVQNSADELEAEDISFIYGKDALLCYAAPSAGLMTPSAGYIFEWTGFMGSVRGSRMKKFRMEHLEADRIEAEMSYDMKQVGSDLGIFMYDCVQ